MKNSASLMKYDKPHENQSAPSYEERALHKNEVVVRNFKEADENGTVSDAQNGFIKQISIGLCNPHHWD